MANPTPEQLEYTNYLNSRDCSGYEPMAPPGGFPGDTAMNWSDFPDERLQTEVCWEDGDFHDQPLKSLIEFIEEVTPLTYREFPPIFLDMLERLNAQLQQDLSPRRIVTVEGLWAGTWELPDERYDTELKQRVRLSSAQALAEALEALYQMALEVRAVLERGNVMTQDSEIAVMKIHTLMREAQRRYQKELDGREERESSFY